jgi:REP element-mobilizing transposase RayT
LEQIISKKRYRNLIRLQSFDYSKAGAFFVTICTQDRRCLFGDVANGQMQLNHFGEIVKNEWLKTEQFYPNVKCDGFVIMPNHFHGIVQIFDPQPAIVGAIHESHLQSPVYESPQRMTITQRRQMTLPKLIGRFKMVTAKQINILRNTSGQKLWQRNYYEHIIRDECEFYRVLKYIEDNPMKWGSIL